MTVFLTVLYTYFFDNKKQILPVVNKLVYIRLFLEITLPPLVNKFLLLTVSLGRMKKGWGRGRQSKCFESSIDPWVPFLEEIGAGVVLTVMVSVIG